MLSILLVLGLGSLILVANLLTPDKFSNVLLVYLVVALIGFAAATLGGFYIRKLFGQREFLNNYIGQASRQGIWLSIILVVSLVLTHQGLFTWINAALLVLTFIFFESYLLTKDKSNDREP